MKKFVAANKFATYAVMSAVGLAAGMAAAKLVIDCCCPTKKLVNKAKKALKTVESTLSM